MTAHPSLLPVVRNKPLPWWVKLLLAYLAAITIIGKGPTYLGIPPFFWGEITLVLSLLLIVPWALKAGYLARNRALTSAIVLFMALGAALTAISFPQYGLNALRDAAIWYYGLFYFVGLGLAARETIADRAWLCLRIFWIVALVWNTIDLLTAQGLSHSGPIIPWRGLPIFFNSTHEAGQNLALGAIIVLCTTTLHRKPLLRAVLIPIALLGLGLFAIAEGRGMRLGIAVGGLAAMLLGFAPRKPHLSTRLITLSAVAIPVLALASLVYTDRIVTVAHIDRFQEANPADPTGTANWRVVWWQYLYRAVMENSPVFGLGFGESLHLYHPTLQDLHGEFVVRAPHNIHMTVFTRMGVAGFALWALVLTIGIGTLFRRTWVGAGGGKMYAPERRDELSFWIVMLVCTLVNSSFGVLMEGPVLGVWFWFALGFASGRSLSPGFMASMAPVDHLRRLFGRPDFRHNPLKAVAKRVAWRMRWMGNSKPIELRMNGGFSVAAPRGAVGALIYYLGNSEPESARFVERFLKAGMVFFDVGAHIGEYTLIASRRVGPQGSVHAFEAQPNTFALLERNCKSNSAANVRLNACAVSDCEGEVEFDVCAEPAMSSLASESELSERRLNRIRVPAVSLDQYCRREGVWPNLLKIDVEGAEWLVLRGAREVLSRSDAPAVIFECLPETYARFGHSAENVLGYLRSLGYDVHRMEEGGELSAQSGELAGNVGYNLVAIKR